MQKTKLLLGLIICLTIAFLGFRVFKLDTYADFVRPVILPLVTVLYCVSGNKKSGYFFYFLLLYSISEVIGIFYYYATISRVVDNLMYYVCNLLYVAAYFFLILEVVKYMNFKKVFDRFKVHIIILLLLDIYCVILVSDVAVKSGMLENIYDYILEFVYNTVIMALLTATLINYLSRDSKKAMNLLLGALCIVFSEVIQVAYFYVTEINILSIAYSVLLVIAFIFFYLQAGMLYSENRVYKPLEKLGA